MLSKIPVSKVYNFNLTMQTMPSWSFLCKNLKKSVQQLTTMMSTTATTPVLNDITMLNKKPDDGSVKPFEAIPGPKSNPVIHVLKNFMPLLGKYTVLERYKYFEDIYKTYGSIVKEMAIGGIKIVHLFDPKDIETLFRATLRSSVRPALDSLQVMRSKRPDIYKQPGIFAVNGQDWQPLRRKFQIPMLQDNSVEHYCGAMDNVAQEFVTRLTRLRSINGEVQDILNEFYKWALESLGLVIFNTRLRCLEDNLSPESETMRLVKAVQDSFMTMNKLDCGLQLYRWFRTPNYRKLEAAQLSIARTAEKYINNTLDRIKGLPQDSQERNMILVKLLSMEGTAFGDVIVMINDLLLAGVDTTSHTTLMTLYHLARNSNQQEKLASEIRDVLPAQGNAITPECLQNLRYLRVCVKESMRLSPITDGNARITDKDMVVAGYNIPAGTLLVTHHRVIGRKIFEDADHFLPERWLKGDSRERSTHHPFAMLPFGFGPRMCLGRRIAEQEMYLLLARLIQRFKIEYHYEDIEMISRFVNVPDKVPKIALIERQM